MADAGTKKTDKQIASLESKIEEVYSEAEKDIQEKLTTFMGKYSTKNQAKLTQLGAGEITQSEYNNWVQGQVFQSQQWTAKKSQIVNTVTNANKVATKMVNGEMYGVFAFNSNYQAYDIEKSCGINFGFGLYDTATVTNLIKNDPQILPEWKIDEKKDYIWNSKKVNNAITQGIIQGESLDQISKRLSTGLCAQNENTMKTFARTGMTQAQNAGRYQRQMDAKALGINLVKEWMSTLDGRTRDSHRHMDGEKMKVGDKWHPQKFSNGLRYPGDPQGAAREVYNCRCTLVADVVDYPAEYERYDNIDGKPIKNMTYDEWAKAKGGVGQTKTKYKKISATSSKKSTNKEKSEVEILQDKLTSTEDQLTAINEEIAAKGADKKFEGIWYNQTVTYADWDTKKDSIQGKKDYYENKIDSTKQDFYQLFASEEEGEDIWNVFSDYYSSPSVEKADNLKKVLADYGYDSDDLKDIRSAYLDADSKVSKWQEHLDDLTEFETHGEEYSQLLSTQNNLKSEVSSFKTQIKLLNNNGTSSTFSADAYSQERKDNAVWAKSPKQADSVLRGNTGKVWKAATEDQQEAIYEYTRSYSKFNEPLRGWEYGQSNYRTGAGFKGVGNTDLNAGSANNGKKLNNMTDIINTCTYEEDIWLNRGCDFGGMDSFFGCSMDLLENGSQSELEDALLGTTPTEYGFMSCGSSKGMGFSGNIKLNIYAPAGTKMMYVEPFSAFGDGDGLEWDGESTQSYFGSELETILQQGTQFRVTKVERTSGTLYFDLEVIDQSTQQRWEG